MKTKTLSGNTFEHRERLKQMGGRWDASEKNWKFDFLSPRDTAELMNLPGCMLTDAKKPVPPIEPQEKESAEDFIARIAQREEDNKRPTVGIGQTKIYGDDTTYFNHFMDKNPKSFFGFSSLSEMVKFVEDAPASNKIPNDYNGYGGAKSWAGSPNMNAAIKLAREGWEDGVNKAAEVLEKLNVDHAVERRRSHSVAGGSVNVGRMLAGNPAHMRHRPKQPGRRIVKLFVQNAASAFMNEDILSIRAAIIAAIADVLEMNGYSCEISSIISMDFHNGQPASQIVTMLKNAGEKLNLNDLVFSLGHPSFLRRLSFACTVQAPELRGMWSYQGMPVNAFNDEYPPSKNEFYIPKLAKNATELKQLLKLTVPKGLPIQIGE